MLSSLGDCFNNPGEKTNPKQRWERTVKPGH